MYKNTLIKIDFIAGIKRWKVSAVYMQLQKNNSQTFIKNIFILENNILYYEIQFNSTAIENWKQIDQITFSMLL